MMRSARRILVVEDEPGIGSAARDFLRATGLEVDEAATCAAAEESTRRNAPDVVVLGDRLPDGDSLGLLPRLKTLDPDLPVVILAGFDSIDLAMKAIQAGAAQFLTKPIELPALQVILDRMLEDRRLRRRQIARGSRRAGDREPFLGASPPVRRLEEEARSALSSESPILIQGETGAGKGVLAEWLHRHGPRADEAFVGLPCAGRPRDLLGAELFGLEPGALGTATAAHSGLFEVARHGTVFLDEIGDLDPAVQAKLLEVIEEHRYRRPGETCDRFVDIQLIVATRQDLVELVRERRFREELYYRIGAISLRIPPLRERPDDIPAIARALLAELCVEIGRPQAELTSEARVALQAYRWPENVRELRNVLERALLRAEGDEIVPRHLGLDSRSLTPGSAELSLTMAQIERRHIERMLEAEGWHVERAARRLGIPRSTLYQRLKVLGLRPPIRR
jgi:DNA-binding NtrC family response regulator